jgi:hypothetical protein
MGNVAAPVTSQIKLLQRRLRGFVTLILCAVGFSSCSDGNQSADVQKFESSELHAIGNSCKGDFLVVRGGNFVYVNGPKTMIAQKNIKITDLGSHRLVMTANYGRFNMVTTFALKHNETVATIEAVAIDPELTPEQWVASGIPEVRIRDMLKEMKATAAMVLCPASAA